MVRLLLALCLVLCGTAAHAADAWSWVDGVTVAAAPPVSIARASCACGDSCQCAGELVELRAYRDKMNAWLADNAGRAIPMAYARTVSTSQVVQQTTPVVTYSEVVTDEPVCVGGQCYAPSRGGYTNGYYTNWMQPYATGTRRGLFTGKRIRGAFGGSCANGMCN